MSKTYRNDAKNDKWRREKQRRNNPNQQWQKPVRDVDSQSDNPWEPIFDKNEFNDEN